jgi:hypothetical protein
MMAARAGLGFKDFMKALFVWGSVLANGNAPAV